MFDFINYGADKLQIFILIILRLSGLFLIAPIFSNRAYPVMLKAGLMIVLALILVSTIDAGQVVAASSLWQLAGLGFKEILVGFIMGLFYQLIFYAAQTGGSIVGYQVGLAMANEFDPNTSSQVSLFGRFWALVATMLFFALNGHHMMISAFVDSYLVIPAGAVEFHSGVGELMIKYTAYVFVIALKLVAPIMVTLFLTDIALGTIAKTMPTMNVFFVGFPVKIAAGLAVVALSLPIAAFVLEKSLHFLDQELRSMLIAMGSA